MSVSDPSQFDGAQLLKVREAHRLPELIVAGAGALVHAPVALYVVDLDGSYLLRLSGGGVGLPDRFAAPLAIGTELPVEAFEALRDLVARSAPEVGLVSLVVRDRAVGFLACASRITPQLEAFAAEAALALELAAG